MKNVICLWWSSKPACAFCPFLYPFWEKSNVVNMFGCSIKGEKKKPMEDCGQPVFVKKVKHDLKNTLCAWFTWNSLFADLGQDLTVGHPTGTPPMHSTRHWENSAKSIAVLLLKCCHHHVRAWLSALCCVPHLGGHLWGGLQKHQVPTDDTPMGPSRWELGAVGDPTLSLICVSHVGTEAQEGLTSTA